jgi:hypothetical protein
VTAAQRLRLVLALGVINLILATAALSLGIFGMQTPPSTAGGPTPDTAFASPTPTALATAAGPGETAAATTPPATSTPGAPGPTPIATSEPSATPTTEPSATPVPAATATPAPAATATPAPAATVAPTQAPPAEPAASRPPPILAVANPTTAPPTGPSDVTGASSTTAPVDMAHQGDKGKHAEPMAQHGQVVHHKPTSHRQGHRDAGQQASADKARRNHKSGRRLRRRPHAR